MQRRDHIDMAGAGALVAFAILLGFNQVVIKFANDGFQPVFMAGVRSLGAAILLTAWIRLRRIPLGVSRRHLGSGLLMGLIFSFEFVFMFLSLDLTSVVRSSVIFYSMPLWLTIGAHFLLPGDRITWTKTVGLVLAFGGVAWAILDRGQTGEDVSIWGDLCALLAALGWAGIPLCARGTNLREVRPEAQLMFQLVISAVVLLGVAWLFGPFLRQPEPIHYWALAFQIVAIATVAFLFWLWLLTIYPASGVASFSFLSPVIGVGLGWLLLDETVGLSLLGSLALVVVGLILINRPPRRVAATIPAE